MERTIEAVSLGVAVWRLSRMIIQDDGPGEILKSARYYTGTEDDFGIVAWEDATSLQKLHSCSHCLSPWLAAILLILRMANKRLYYFILMSLTASGITVLLDELLEDSL